MAAQLAETIEKGGLLCLYGDLGSGKTTFTRHLAESLGIEKFTVKSPTYTYIRHLKTAQNTDFYHIDLYRINTIDELLFEEILELTENPENIIVIEWADKMQSHLPENRREVYFKFISGQKREIKF